MEFIDLKRPPSWRQWGQEMVSTFTEGRTAPQLAGGGTAIAKGRGLDLNDREQIKEKIPARI